MGSLSIVRASAGSGKTYLLAVEYIAAAMKHPAAYRSILAVTFTNKATAEMKRRILTELSALAKGEQGGFFDSIAERTSYSKVEIQQRAATTLGAILRDYSSFSVSTIDKFFQRIVRSFFRELGLDLHYLIEIDNSETLAEAIDSLIDRSATDRQLARKINRIVTEELDAGQRVNPHGALEKLARNILSEQFTASSADDQTIDAIFESLKDEYQTACTLLRNKAIEACRTIEGASLSVDDFKSKNKGFAAYSYKVSASRSTIPAYGENFRKAANSTDENQYATKETIDRVRSILPSLMEQTRELVELYDRTLKLRATFSSIASAYSRYTLLRHLSQEFTDILSSRQQLSISATSELIASIIDGADVPFIFERLGNRYSTIFIDEFQDTSPSQWEGFLPLLHEAIAKCDERCVMLIGDIKQAIYRFRGGDWRLLGGIADAEFEGFTEKSLTLNTSWRSDRKIVEFNNAIMRHIVVEAEALINNYLDQSLAPTDHLRTILADAYSDMEQNLPSGKPDGGYVETYRGDKAETLGWVVDKVRDIESRYPLSHAAILVRCKAEGNEVASALIANGINIISDELLTVGSSASTCFVVDVLKYAISPNSVTLASINQFLGRPFLSDLTDDQSAMLPTLRSMTSIEAFETIIKMFSLQQSDPFYLQSLYNLIYTHSKDESSDLGSFVEAWDRSLRKSAVALPEIDGAIRIMTIHKAKGLEFDSVIIPFFSWEMLPGAMPATTVWCQTPLEPYNQFNPIPLTYNNELGQSIYADQYVEQGVSSVVDNINLIYVAITRAKSELYLGLGGTQRVKPAAALLTSAVDKYLGGDSSIGEPIVTIKQQNETPHDTIIFDRIESFDPPKLKILNENDSKGK